MDPRFERRRRQLLEDALIKPQVYREVLDRLPGFLAPFLDPLVRREQEEHLHEYVQGLLSNVPRKNVENIAYLHDHERRELQRFIGESDWAYQPMLHELAQQVGRELGESDAVLTLDPSGFEKDGKHSVGVKRQWLGRLGKVENGQVGVYLGYASRKGQALCNVRLYLPEEWATDRTRRQDCGVPREVRFATRQELAQQMLLEHGPLLPHQWVTGDDEMGRSSGFRGWLRDHSERYLLAVPSNTSMRDLEVTIPDNPVRKTRPLAPWTSVSVWMAQVPESRWERIDVRDGEKGALVMETMKCRVQAREERRHVGPEELLFVTRVKEHNKWKTDYYLSSAPADTPLAELARVAKAQHRIEECFKCAKSEAGMADYEVRTWRGWHHHMTLVLLASWFLTLETKRGKKIHACTDGAADKTIVRHDVA